MSLDDLLGGDDGEPARERRGGLAAGTFALAVVAGGALVVLAGLLLWGLVYAGIVLFASWFDGFG